MSEDHTHGSAANVRQAAGKYKHRLLWSFWVIGGYFIVELVGGLMTNSLALLSDAGHMLTDVLGLGMAVAAIRAADRVKRDPQKTFGLYRLEILAALANAVLLFGVALYILYEAIERFQKPPAVLGAPMLFVAIIGLAVNLLVFFWLRGGASESINVEGAYLEVLADLLGSVGVIVAAVVIQATGFRLIDPIFGTVIGVFVLPRTWRLARKAIRILIQAAPPDLDIKAMHAALENIDGVCAIHDLHAWTLTSGMEICSVHLCLQEGAETASVLKTAQNILHDQFGMNHPTIQIEPEGFMHCEQSNSGTQNW
ncbi:MAG: cation transporter [Myxococcales bacterium]|nr:MAG: cation transporter [Myxococcales bacterium]